MSVVPVLIEGSLMMLALPVITPAAHEYANITSTLPGATWKMRPHGRAMPRLAPWSARR